MSTAAEQPKRGQLVVISGPSGVGKTTVCETLMRHLPEAMLSVSVTTRPPRVGERDGVDYWFVSPEAFRQRVQRGELLEHAAYSGHQYGTPAGPVHEAIAAGRHVVLEIEVQGGLQVAKAMPESVRIFILPPSDEALRTRLAGRGTEDPAVQARRLAAAQREIELAATPGAYPHQVVNETVAETAEQILGVIQRESESND